MRVLQVCIRYPPARGGVEVHVEALARGLAARGHDVEVATSTLRTEFPFEPLPPEALSADREGPVRVHRFPARTLGGDAHWPWLAGLDRWLLAHARRFDVIHAHSYGFHHTLAALAAARLAGVPSVLTPHFHPHWSMELGPRRRHLRRAFDAVAKGLLLGAPDAVVCVSREEARLLGAPRPEALHHIPNGVHPGPFAAARGEALRDRLGLRGPVALYVGRLAANKGLLTLLDAWAARVAAGAGGTLLVVGGGHLAGILAERCKALGLGERVVLAGALSDAEVRQAYAACDALVLPSEYEAFGIVLLEAMAAGKPVVATRAGGMAEVVEDGATGLLVPVGDAPALAEALRRVLDDPALARRLGAAGRDRVGARFTWEAVTAQVEALYGAVRRGRGLRG